MDTNEKQIDRPEFIRLKEDFWTFKKDDLLSKNEERKGYNLHIYSFERNNLLSFDFVDRLPDLFETVGEKQIEIHMVISCKDFVSEDEMNDRFVSWVESQGWTCGGSVKELDE